MQKKILSEPSNMAETVTYPYLYLLKRALTDTFYNKKIFKKFLAAAHSLTDAEVLVIQNTPVDSYTNDGWVKHLRAETMIGIPRLANIEACIEEIIRKNIAGDVIETGVWRGGAAIFMRAVLKQYNSDKKVFVADSFMGLPKPNAKKYPADKGDKHHKVKFLRVSLADVKRNFQKYGMLDDKVRFIKGFFARSLPHAPIKKLALLRLDGDMYSSTWEVLSILYEKVSFGGFIIIDDYYLPACKKAVDDFRKANKIRTKLKRIDWTGVYWKKTK